MKKCSKCGKIKPIEEFSWRNKQKAQKLCICKECANEYNKQYYERNKDNPEYREKHNERGRQNYERNKDNPEYREKHIEQARQYYEQNKEKRKEYSKEYCEQNKEKYKEYYEQNKEKHSEQMRQYYEQNKEKINEWARQRNNDKYKTNPMFRLNKCISRSIRNSLKGNKNGCHWEDLVGYNLEELKEHLELQFQPGMSWDNYGEWHIHHIIPISWWEFEKPEDEGFKRCWALDNLQPLWAKDNLKKGNKV